MLISVLFDDLMLDLIAIIYRREACDLLKKQCPDANVLLVGVFPNTRVQDQISTPNYLPVFHYSQLKINGCFLQNCRTVIKLLMKSAIL